MTEIVKNQQDFQKMKWTFKYIEQINTGKIAVDKEILKVIELIRKRLKKYIFVQDEVDRRIDFVQKETANTKGSHDFLKLALPEKFWIENIYGFFIEYKSPEDYLRLTHQVPLVVSRGTGKTTLAATFALIGILLDNEYGADVQCFAKTKEQASQLFDTASAMINKEGTILRAYKERGLLNNYRNEIRFKPTNSIMKIKVSDYRKLDGTNSHYNVFDEVHSYTQDFIKIVNDGSSKKRKNWMSFYITTNGTVRGNVFDRYYEKWEKILNQDVEDDSVLPFIYKLDSTKEVHDPNKWMKAIPLINITTPAEVIEKDVKASLNDPSDQAELLAKTFNIPATAAHLYFNVNEIYGNKELFDPDVFVGNDYRKARAIMGLDFADINDILAISFMIKKNDIFYFKNLKMIPKRGIDKKPFKIRQQYQKWIDNGELLTHDNDYNSRDVVIDAIEDFCKEQKIGIIGMGYDQWHAREVAEKMKSIYGVNPTAIRQGAYTLSDPMKQFKVLLDTKKISFDSDLDTWNMGHVEALKDGNGNIKPSKSNPENKIDVFAAMLDAYTCYKMNEQEYDPLF